MTVNATDADDAINVNNGIIGYSILSEEPKSAQRMFTIDPQKGVISVIGTGLDREVGALAASWGTTWQLRSGTCHREPGMPEPRCLAGLGTCDPWLTVPCSGVSAAPNPSGICAGDIAGPPALLSPGSGWSASPLGGQWGCRQASVPAVNAMAGEGWRSRQVMLPEEGDTPDPITALTVVISSCRPLPTTR